MRSSRNQFSTLMSLPNTNETIRTSNGSLLPEEGMIYDPSRRAQKVRQRILESMSAEEIEEYAVRKAGDRGGPVA